MPANARKLALYLATGLSLLMIFFPPFTVVAYGAPMTQYGFLFSGPAAINQAMGTATVFGGPEGARMMGHMVNYHLDWLRLSVQLAIVWGLYVALLHTVLKPMVLLLLVTMIGAGSACAADFTYKTMFITAMKLNPSYDFEAGADGYMQIFRPTVWQASHNDEFEFEQKKKDTILEMKRVAAMAKAAEPIVIHTQAEFGEYDFKIDKFAFSPLGETSVFTIGAPCCIQNNAAPYQFRLGFSNPSFLNGIPMPQDTAHAFLSRHKQYGNINRTLQLELTVVPKSVEGENEIVGEIVNAVIRDPLAHDAPVITLPSS